MKIEDLYEIADKLTQFTVKDLIIMGTELKYIDSEDYNLPSDELQTTIFSQAYFKEELDFLEYLMVELEDKKYEN